MDAGVTVSRLRTASEAINEILGAGAYGVGGQLSAVHRGMAIADLAFGRRGLGGPMESTIVHPMYCLTKPFAAVGMWLLEAEEGISFELDHPLDQVAGLNEFVSPTLISRLTARDLLNNVFDLSRPNGSEFRFTPPGVFETAFRQVEPGAGANYSEYAAWYVLEVVASLVSGGSLADYIERGVLKALNLQTQVGLSECQLRDLKAQGLLDVPVGGLPNSQYPFLGELTWQSLRFARPGFGGFASVSALARLAGALLDRVYDRPTKLSDSLSAPSILRNIERGRGCVWDQALNRECDFSGGFMKDVRKHGLSLRASTNSIGHAAGFFPSALVIDFENDLAVAFYLNGMVSTYEEIRMIRSQIIDSVYEDLGLGLDGGSC